jgi:hypothetical protein
LTTTFKLEENLLKVREEFIVAERCQEILLVHTEAYPEIHKVIFDPRPKSRQDGKVYP